MPSNSIKRILSFATALALTLTMVPVQAFAAETESRTIAEPVAAESTSATEAVVITETEASVVETTIPAETDPAGTTAPETVPAGNNPVETTVPDTIPGETVPVETNPVQETEPTVASLEARMDDILLRYLGATVLSKDEVLDIVVNMFWDTMEAALNEMNALEPEISALSPEELAERNANYPGAETIGCFYDTIILAMTPSFFATSGSYEPATGVTVDVSGATNTTSSNGEITVTAKGSEGFFGLGASAKTATITVTFVGSDTSNVAFKWTATSVNQLVIDGKTYTDASGNFTKEMENGDSFTITITTAKNATENKLVLKDFSVTSLNKEFSVGLSANNAALGSITVDNAAPETDTVSVPATGVSIKATPKTGSTFVCWVNAADNTVYSKDNPHTLKPTADINLKAMFSDGAPFFYVNNVVYDTWESAIAAAKSASAVAVLANNATLAAGEYEVPSGVTLLVPFDNDGTCYTTEPVAENATPKDPIPFRTLTMADGAKITVNGIMSVSSKVYAGGSGQTAGMPKGEFGHIAMNEGSSIVVNSGATLSVFGYITGAGSVTANSGATVYEVFQIMDFRGGQATFNMNGITSGGNDGDVFPFSQYYAQNIEVPLTIHAGATEKAYTALYMSRAVVDTTVAYIGSGSSGAMFNLTSGYMIKRYDKATDRLVADIYGDLTIANVSIDIILGITYTVNSKVYVLPINSNMTVNVNSGTVSVAQDLAMLPGSQVNISSDAKFILGSSVRLYAYDGDQWGNYVYNNAKLKPVAYVYNRAYTRTVADLIDACITVAGTLDASAGALYTTSSGAAIKGVEGGKVIAPIGSEKVTYQASQSGTDVSYPEIPITPAQLLNADKSYTKTADATANSSNTYTYTNGVWRCATHTEVTDAAVDATCSSTGKTEGKHCSACGTVTVEQEEIAKLPHTEVIDAAKAPTCTVTGLTEGKHCSVCGEVIVAQEEVPMADHNYNAVVTAPTCESEGFTTYTCSACGDSYTADKVASLGHSYSEKVTTAATCTEKGVKTFTCGNCGDTFTEEIAALGHDYVDHAAQDATCTEKGWNAYQTCSRCDYTTYSEIAALDHDYKAAVTAPTCTEQGFTTYTCSRCNDSYVDNYVDALGHKYNAVVTDPTCDAEGFTTYTCSACGDSYVDNEVSALGHNWGEGTITTKPTCTNAGIMTFTCQNDATHIKNEAVAALGHSWVDADCDTPKTCSVCGETEGAALGHTAGEVVVENNKAATCTAAGSYDNVTRCTVCGAETSRETVTVNALGHTEAEAVVENNVAPDCVNDGSYDSVVKCSVCGEEVRRETIVVPASGHDYDAVVTAPACESAGYTTYTCSICSDSYTADEVAALGHTDGKVVVENEKAATCTATGSYDNVTYCTVCGVETSRETITVDALDHTAEVIPGKDATCTETGLTEGKHCSVCNEVLVAQEVVTALGHTEVTDAAKAPTCTETGLTEGKHCSVCNEVLVAQTVVDALGHTEVIDAAVAATCTETGLTEGKHCSVCGEVIVAQTVVDALGHTEVIDEAVAPDCENAGLTEGKHCSVCGEVTVAQEEVAALGHDYKSEITAPTFEADGYTTYTCSRCGDNYVETHEGTQLIAVAKIGDTKFQTLSEAFEAAEEGDTIELLKNHTVTSSETWDLTGKTLKVPSGIRIIIKGCYLTIEGGTFNIDGAITNYCGLTINNGTFYLKNQSITTDGGGTLLKINGGEFHVSGGGVGIYVRFAVGYIYNGTFTAEEGSTILGMSANNSVLTVSGGSYSQDVTDYLSDGYCCPLRDGMYVVGVHTAAEAVKENEAAATCTATGSYDEVVYCSGCNAELSRNTVTVDALGHTAGEVVVENNVEATCTATGSYDNVTYCTVCDAELSRDTVTVEKLAHTEVAVPGKAATCTETGLTDGAKCSVCGETLTAQEEIPALGHTDGDVAVENEKDATCTAEGSYDNVVYCSVCDEELSRDTVTVDKIAHTVVIDEAVAATCTETGLTEGSHCDVCGEVLVNQEEVAALGHSYNTVVTDPTCTEYGYTTYTCSVCGNSYQDDEVTEFGHDYVAVVTEPTCIKDGYTTYSCSRCEDSYTDDVTTATGVHTYVNGVCSGCGKVELFDLYGSNMTLGNDLSINFFIVKSNLKGTDYYVEIEKFYHNNQDPVKKRIEYSEFDTQGDLWKVTFNGVAAKEMTDNVYVTVYHSDGTPASNKYVTSIRDYAMKVLNSTATVPKVKTVAVDMLNYGAAAQVHFGYNTSDLANNILTDTQKTLATQSVEYSSKYEKGAKYYGTVLSLESNIILNMYHYPITKDMSAVVKYTDYLGVSKLIEIDGSNFYERGDLLGVIVDELVLADGFQVVTCEIYDTNGNLISTTKESVESYVARATASTNADPIYEELIKFVYSARDYFLNK